MLDLAAWKAGSASVDAGGAPPSSATTTPRVGFGRVSRDDGSVGITTAASEGTTGCLQPSPRTRLACACAVAVNGRASRIPTMPRTATFAGRRCDTSAATIAARTVCACAVAGTSTHAIRRGCAASIARRQPDPPCHRTRDLPRALRHVRQGARRSQRSWSFRHVAKQRLPLEAAPSGTPAAHPTLAPAGEPKLMEDAAYPTPTPSTHRARQGTTLQPVQHGPRLL